MKSPPEVKRIERVLRLREFEERLRRQEWAAAQAKEQDAEAVVESARVDVTDLEEQRRRDFASGAISPERLLDLAAALEAAAERVDRALVLLDRARRDRTAKESTWREAKKRAKALERLREIRLDRAREDESRIERKDTDEVALVRYVRARSTTEGSRS